MQVVEFFFGGMRVAGDHEIYGDLSDVPPQRLREDMGLVVCKSFSRFCDSLLIFFQATLGGR